MSTNTKMTSTNTSSEQQLTADNKRYNAINRIPRMKEGDKLRLWLSFPPPADDECAPRHDVMIECETCEEAWTIACAYQALHYLETPLTPPYTWRPDKPDSRCVMLNMHMIAATKDFQIALLSGIESPNMEDWVDMGYKNWSDPTITPPVFSAKEYQEAIQEQVKEKDKWFKEHAHCTKGSCSCIL